jgi:hypothetical protein
MKPCQRCRERDEIDGSGILNLAWREGGISRKHPHGGGYRHFRQEIKILHFFYVKRDTYQIADETRDSIRW